MARTKRGTVVRAKHKRVVREAKGFRGRRKNVLRIARQAVTKALQYSYNHRRMRRRAFRSMWISGINSVTRSFGYNYNKLISHLRIEGVGLNRKVLYHIAVNDPTALQTLLKIKEDCQR
ncbi:50S ribosomal protein L20 [Candidatus Tremblaya phenacola PAVE]|nr:50S ribosomal protein L20 [Candidatus Tremblaya phenacola PAVE]